MKLLHFVGVKYTSSEALWQEAPCRQRTAAGMVAGALPQHLERKVKIVDQGAWDPVAPRGALMIRAGIEDQLALGGKAEEALTEHAVD